MADSFDLGTLVDEFRDEARDQVDRLDAWLLDLEREGRLGDEARSELLRTLHTLKGNAGMLGLSPIRDFVHTLENAFKSERESWPDALVERLFEGAAALRAAVEVAGTGADQEEAFAEVTRAGQRLDELGTTGTEERAVATRTEASGPAPPSDHIRVPFPKLDVLLNEVGELIGDADALSAAIRDGDEVQLRAVADSIRRRADILRESVMSLRLVPVGRVVGRFRGLARRLARDQGKEARLVVEGESTELDKSTAEALAEPLLHLVRNAIDHGVRTPDRREAAGKPRYGTIRISAHREGDRIEIAVEDDGVGLSADAIRARAEELEAVDEPAALTEEETRRLIFEPGFSTRTDVSTVSGRGVGLDVVRRNVRALRGDLRVEQPEAGGTRFVLRLPLTVVIVPSLVFEAAGEIMALPTTHVDRTLRMEGVERVGATEVLRDGESLVPVVDPDRLFGWEPVPRGELGVLVRHGRRGAVLTVKRLIDQRELVVKGMPAFGRRAPGVSGGSVLPGGRVVLVLDPAELVDLTNSPARGGDRG